MTGWSRPARCASSAPRTTTRRCSPRRSTISKREGLAALRDDPERIQPLRPRQVRGRGAGYLRARRDLGHPLCRPGAGVPHRQVPLARPMPAKARAAAAWSANISTTRASASSPRSTRCQRRHRRRARRNRARLDRGAAGRRGADRLGHQRRAGAAPRRGRPADPDLARPGAARRSREVDQDSHDRGPASRSPYAGQRCKSRLGLAAVRCARGCLLLPPQPSRRKRAGTIRRSPAKATGRPSAAPRAPRRRATPASRCAARTTSTVGLHIHTSRAGRRRRAAGPRVRRGATLHVVTAVAGRLALPRADRGRLAPILDRAEELPDWSSSTPTAATAARPRRSRSRARSTPSTRRCISAPRRTPVQPVSRSGDQVAAVDGQDRRR